MVRSVNSPLDHAPGGEREREDACTSILRTLMGCLVSNYFYIVMTVAGSKSGIEIPAVFVSKVAGEILAQHANGSRPDCWILPSSYENISWLVMVTSFIFLLGMIAAFAIYFLVQSRRQAHGRGSKQCRGISCQIVKALPTYTYKCEYGIQTIDACAICLEDYVDGASLRVLPCNHRK